MNTKKDMGHGPPDRNLAIGLGLVTSLVLLCAVGLLATSLASLLGTEPPPAAASIVPTVERAATSVETPWMTFFGKAILTVVTIAALAIIAPLVGALCLFGLLRRYGKQLGPLIHVEYTNPPSVVVGPFTASSLGGAGGVASTAQHLNLGPSFEDERLHKVEQINRMDAAVVGQLFEDNLKLQEKIELARENERTSAAEVSGPLVLSTVDS